MNQEKQKLTPRQVELRERDAAARTALKAEPQQPSQSDAAKAETKKKQEIAAVMREDEHRAFAQSAMKPTLEELEERQ